MASSDPSAQSEQLVREVFRRYYEKLSKLRLDIVAAHLVTGNVINSDDHESIRAATNTSDKSAIILRAIASHLDVECTDTFILLLDLMEQLGDVVMKKVAGEINQQLNRSTRRETNEVSGSQPKQRQQVDFSRYTTVDEAFSVLSATLYRIFTSNNVDFKILRRACIENVNTPFGACIPEQLVAEIKASDDLNELFDVLAWSPYWNWINIRILTKMVDVSGVDEAMELVERYKEAVFSRKLVLLLKEIKAINIPADYYTVVEQKWNRSLDEVTVKDLVTQWSKMEELFGVKEPTLLLSKVFDGCVEIHWLIPTQLAYHVCCAVFNSRHMSMSILHLKIGDHVILHNDEDTGGYIDTSSDSIAKGDGGLSYSSLTQQLSSSHGIKPLMVVHVFNNVVEFIITQLSTSSSLEHYLIQCKSLMASDTHRIGMFTDAQLRELDKHSNKMLLLQQLQPLWSWSDHSILKALAGSCDEAVQVLTQFDDHLNHSQLISAYPIPCVSPTMTPSDDAPYTVLAVRYEQLIYQCSLQCVFDVRALLMKTCEITAHCLQLLAARADPTVIYWSIPKCVVSLVVTKVLEYHKAIHDGMISEVCIYPSIRIATGNGRILGPLAYLSPYMPASDYKEAPGLADTERAELITNWLSKPENLYGIIDKLICDIKTNEDDMFQLTIDHHQMCKMFQHVRQQNSQLQGDLYAQRRDVTEYRELYEKKARDYDEVLMKKEQQIKELEQQLSKTHSTDSVKLEHAIKKLQASLGEFRGEISVYRVSTESSDKCMSEKQLEDFGDIKSVKLSRKVMERDDKELAEKKLKDSKDDSLYTKLTIIDHEVVEAKAWANEMKKQNLELSKALKDKSREAEDKNIKLKQLEADQEVANLSNSQIEKLKKEKKLLLKRVADLRTKPENIPFGSGRYGKTIKMNSEGTWCTAKILHDKLLKYSQSPDHLVAEVKKRCNTLQHNNLVMFIGITVVDKQLMIMTELMEVNLFTYIEQHSNLTLDTQVALCKDMSRGLQELHKHLLLHKNLHSRNILIHDNQAKISDYYYPLLQAEGYTPPDVTDTALFVAPEVIEDQSNYSEGSDVFSLAVLFLVVITRKVPMLQEHKQNLTAGVHSHILLPLIQKCLSKQTDSRPSAATICDDIKAAQDSPQYIGFRALTQTNSVPLFQALKSGSKNMKWRTCATLPAPLVDTNAVVLDNVIYVSGGESPDEYASRYVFAYHFLENRWDRLPQLSHTHGVPIVISNQLVIIGGKELKSRRVTNQISTYNGNEQKWESVYPNLGKERYAPLAVTYKHYVIVAGGKYHTLYLYDRLYDDIEVLNVQDTERLSWKRVPTRLPSKMWSPSATISNDQLWIVGFNNDNSGSLNLIEQRSDEVFWIPVANIIATDKKGKWESLPRVMPYYSSTVVPYSNPVVTVGGDTRDTRTTNAIEIHDAVNNLWEQVAYLDGPSRAYVAVASIGERQAIVVLGGCTETKNKKSRNDSSLALVQIGYAV